MQRARIAAALTFGVLVAAAQTSGAAEKADLGKQEYEATCAACHGPQGKGDGSYGELLKTRASDLTVLAKNNGGVFPVARVYDVIDGRQAVKAHGDRDMPIWGTQFSVKAAEHYVDVPYDAEGIVRGRILALIDYLYRLQAR